MRRLELNNTGAWKLVLYFELQHETAVKESAERLAAIQPLKWRISDNTVFPPRVLEYFERGAWRAP